jgi:hypothetical protein
VLWVGAVSGNDALAASSLFAAATGRDSGAGASPTTEVARDLSSCKSAVGVARPSTAALMICRGVAIKSGRPGIALEQAIGRAVDVLREAAPDMTELRLGGISYQATGVQTSVGPYIEEQVGIALQRAYRNVLSERGLIVKRAELTQGDIARLQKSDSGKSGAPRVKLLRGTIWDFGPSPELRLVLRTGGATSCAAIRCRRAYVLPPKGTLVPWKTICRVPLPLNYQAGVGEHHVTKSVNPCTY